MHLKREKRRRLLWDVSISLPVWVFTFFGPNVPMLISDPQVSSGFCRTNPLRWTPHLQHCYDDILGSAENSNDTLLCYLAELSRILEAIKHAGLRSFPSHQRKWNPAVAVQFRLLMSELHRFKASLPETLQQDGIGIHVSINCKKLLIPYK